MALQINARFIAAAVLSGMLAAPQALALGSGGQPAPVQLADYEAGKEVPLGEEGQAVKAGEELAIIEAMKMENVLRASQDGVVSKIVVKLGDSLDVDQVILEFK